MRVFLTLVVSAAVASAFVVVPLNSNKGAVVGRKKARLTMAVADESTVFDDDTTTTCVQTAVSLVKNDDDPGDDTTTGEEVRVRTAAAADDAAVESTSKKELLNDIEVMMMSDPLVQTIHPVAVEEEEEERALIDIVTCAQSAAVSASLYMNPATEKIAGHVQITWEPDAAAILETLSQVSNKNRPLLVGLVGIPGSGKSTSAEIIQALLEDTNHNSLILPMDGFHIPLAELGQQENSADLIYRRGAPDTFAVSQLHHQLGQIAYGSVEKVAIPGFDHAVGDPIPDAHLFERSKHDIVLVEGLYLLHDSDGWEQIQSFFDWTIYIDAPVHECIERLKTRNKCIPGYTSEEIEIRCDKVDRVNAETARDGAYKYASQIVSSGASS